MDYLEILVLIWRAIMFAVVACVATFAVTFFVSKFAEPTTSGAYAASLFFTLPLAALLGVIVAVVWEYLRRRRKP